MVKKERLKLILIVLFVIFLISSTFVVIKYIKTKDDYKTNYDYLVKIADEQKNIFHIYNKNNRTVIEETIGNIECIKAPCPETIRNIYQIEFSNSNKKLVTSYLKYLSEIYGKYDIDISSFEFMNQYTINVLQSLIENDETLLNSLQEYEIVIETDETYKTMQNDGGSHYNIRYKFNLNTKEAIKYQDSYIGFKGYEYTDKILFSKTISDDLITKLSLVINELSNKDSKDNDNYYPYTIIKSDGIKAIYNEEDIAKLKEIIDDIDKIE